MKIPHFVVAALVLALFAPIAVASQAPAAGASAPIEGVWIYAKDPAGKIKIDAIYNGSTITFEAGGKYAFALAETSKPLTGTWELREAKDDLFKVHTEYGQGRRNDLTLRLRRDAGKAVIGFEVREADDDPATARYYARK